MDQELTEQFNENMRQLTEMMAQLNSTMAGTVKSMNDASTAGKNAATSTKQNADSQSNSTNQIVTGNVKLQEAQKKSGDIMAESAKNFAAAGFAAGNALKSFTQAVVSGEEGFKKYGASFSSIGDSALALGRNFGLLGTAAGLITKAFTAIAGPAFTQADNLLKASDSLSKLGAANAFSTDQIYSMGHKAGLTSQNLDKMIVPMQKMGTSFGAMGQNAEDATKQFSAMINVSEGVRNEFRRLGMNDQDRIQAQADFIETMNKSGMSIRMMEKSSGGLNKASLDYTRNLQVLADITGQSVEQQRKEQEVATANIQFQLYTNKINREIRAAAASGDQKEVDRLNKQLQQARVAVEMANVTGGPEMAAAQAQYIMHGFSTIGVAQQAILGTMDDMQKAGRQVNEGLFNTTEAGKYLDRTVEDVSGNLDQFSTSLSVSPDFAATLGATTDNVQRINEQFGKDHEAAAKNAEARVKANQAGKGAVAEDPLQQARDRLVEHERQAAMALDDLYKALQPGLMNALTNLIDTVVPALVKSLEWLTENLDKVKIAFGVLAGLTGIGAVISVFAKIKNATEGLVSVFGWVGGKLKSIFNFGGGSSGKSSIPESQLLDKSGKPLQGAAKASRIAKLEKDAAEAGQALSKTNKLGKILGKVPGVLGKLATPLAIAGSAISAFSEWSDASAQAKSGVISDQEATKRKAEAVGGAGGSMAGGAIGAALGTAILPGIGTVLGGMLGTALGDKLGRAGADKMTSVVDVVMSPIKAVGTVATSTIDALTPAVSWVTKAFSDISGIMFSLSKLVLYPLHLVGLKVNETFKRVTEGLTGWLKEHPKIVAAFKTVGTWLTNLADSIKRFVGMIGDKLGAWNKGFKDWVSSLYGEKPEPGKPAAPANNNQQAAAQTNGSQAAAPAPVVHAVKTPEQEKTEQETVEKTRASAKTVSEASTRTDIASKKDEVTTKKFDNIVASFGKIVSSDGKIVEAFGKIVVAFNEAVTKFSDNITTFGDIFSMQGGSGSTMGATTGGADPAKIQQAMTSLTNKGWTQAQAAGIVGNLVTESKLNTSAVGDNGKAYGIAQWHPDRQAKFKEVMGKDIRGSSLEDQISFLDWELRHTEKKAGTALSRAGSASQAASIFDRQYERSSGAAIQERMANANAIASGNLSGSPALGGIGDANIVSLGNSLLSQGFRVTENPSFGGVTPGAHKGKGHAEGRAIDINLVAGRDADDPIAGPRLDALAAQLANNPNFTVLWRTGGHFDHMHVETKRGVQAAKGGVFAGSRAGYPATLHGTEMVAPLNLDSVLMKLAKTSTGTPEGQELLGDVKKTAGGGGAADFDRVSLLNREVAAMITSKLDKMIDILDDGNNTRHKILQHSRT